MSVLMAHLGDVAEFINGKAFGPSDWSEEGRRIIRIQNLTTPERPYNRTTSDVAEKYHVHPGELLVSWSASLGVFEWPGPDIGLVNQHIFRVVPDASKIDRNYLRYALSRSLSAMERYVHGSTMRHVNRREFLSTKIPLPPLPEQRRIAAILDKADAVRRKRQQTLDLADRFLRSAFVDMFGDAEAQGWTFDTIEGVARQEPGSIRTGPFGSQLLHSEFVDDGIAVLGIDNAVANEFRWGERRFITEAKYAELKRYRVLPGDVLITIMGTCGRCAIVPQDIPVAINTKHLCCITLDRKKCLPSFLHAYFLCHPIARRYLIRTAKGAIMSGLNMGIIRAMPIPIAPIKLQEKFDHLCGACEEARVRWRNGAELADGLSGSLQQRAFRGKL